MFKFLKEFSIIIAFSVTFFLIILYSVDLSSDIFYDKVSKKNIVSGIFGGSRALNGIDPRIINGKLNRSDIFNFAFTTLHSPFGERYFNFIKNRITNFNNIYILEVSPWSLSNKNGNVDYNLRELESNLLIENYTNGLLGKVKYYFDHNEETLLTLLLNTFKVSKIRKNGFVKRSIIKDEKSIKEKIERYRYKNLTNYIFSQNRFNYLKKTLELLRKKGDVYIVRLPVIQEIKVIEDQLIENFDKKIEDLCDNKNIEYFNFINYSNDFKYSDGNHLEYNSAKKISEIIALKIKDHRQ